MTVALECSSQYHRRVRCTNLQTTATSFKISTSVDWLKDIINEQISAVFSPGQYSQYSTGRVVSVSTNKVDIASFLYCLNFCNWKTWTLIQDWRGLTETFLKVTKRFAELRWFYPRNMLLLRVQLLWRCAIKKTKRVKIPVRVFQLAVILQWIMNEIAAVDLNQNENQNKRMPRHITQVEPQVHHHAPPLTSPLKLNMAFDYVASLFCWQLQGTCLP